MRTAFSLCVVLGLFAFSGCGEETPADQPESPAVPDPPDIELSYGDMTAPDESADCVEGVCTIPQARALDFGVVGLDQASSITITIKNVSACELGAEEQERCDACALTIDANPEQGNIGLGFSVEGNDSGAFSVIAPPELPVVVSHAGCGQETELSYLLSFDATGEEGEHEAVLLIESNDPDEGLIEIPARALVAKAPIAIARLRAPDPTNPSAPYSDPDELSTSERVYLDGRESHNPSVQPPDDPTSLAAYLWEIVEAPDGSQESDFDWLGADTALPSMAPVIAGHYVVRLSVRNELGSWSADTLESRVEFDVLP